MENTSPISIERAIIRRWYLSELSRVALEWSRAWREVQPLNPANDCSERTAATLDYRLRHDALQAEYEHWEAGFSASAQPTIEPEVVTALYPVPSQQEMAIEHLVVEVV